MQSQNYLQNKNEINFSHLGTIMLAMVVLIGMTWMKNPKLFNLDSSTKSANNASVLAYVPYSGTLPNQQPEVLGASTEPSGPMIINDDGTVKPVDMGEVLGASTQGVVLSLDNIKVNIVPDSNAGITKYFNEAKVAENGSIDESAFASSLNSGDQSKINDQAQKLIVINNALQKLTVPESLVELQKLKIIQYNSAITLLQNFTNSNNDPEQTAQNLEQFMKSQQDLDSENTAVAQKFPALDPYSTLYINPDGTAIATPTPNQPNFGGLTNNQTPANNFGVSNAAQ